MAVTTTTTITTTTTTTMMMIAVALLSVVQAIVASKAATSTSLFTKRSPKAGGRRGGVGTWKWSQDTVLSHLYLRVPRGADYPRASRPEVGPVGTYRRMLCDQVTSNGEPLHDLLPRRGALP